MTSKGLQRKMAGKLNKRTCLYLWFFLSLILCVQWWCQTCPSFPSTQAAASTFHSVMFECQNSSLLLPSQSYSSVLVTNPIGLLLLPPPPPLFTAVVAHLERTVSQLLWRFSWTWKRVDLSILRVLFRMLPALPPGHRLVSVNMVCSFLTVLKPLIVSTNSSSSINCRRRMEIIKGNSHISSDMFFSY